MCELPRPAQSPKIPYNALACVPRFPPVPRFSSGDGTGAQPSTVSVEMRALDEAARDMALVWVSG